MPDNDHLNLPLPLAGACPIQNPKSKIQNPVALALLIAIVLQSIAVARSSFIAPDSVTFLETAQRLRESPLATIRASDQHPGYPGLIIGLSKAVQSLGMSDLFDADLLAARLISNISGVLCVLLVWRLTMKLYNPRVAGVAAILFAILPTFRQNSADLLSDSTHLFFYLATACFALEGFARTNRRAASLWFAAAGAASALAYWVRPEGLSAAAVVASLLALCVISTRAFRAIFSNVSAAPAFAHRLRHIALPMAALVAATLLVASPYVLAKGKLTSKKNPLAAPVGAPSREQTEKILDSSTLLASADVSAIRMDWIPGQTLPGEIKTPRARWKIPFAALAEFCREAGLAFRFILLLPLAAGLFAPRRLRPATAGQWLLTALAACHFSLLMVLYCTAGYISNRHLFPIVAVAMPTVAAGMVYLATVISCISWPRACLSSRRLAFSLAVLTVAFLPRAVRPMNESAAPLIDAARWVNAQAQPGDRVLASTRPLRYFSRLPGHVLGVDSDLASAIAIPGAPTWSFILLEAEPAAPGAPDVHLPGYAIARDFTDPRFPRSRVVALRPTTHVANEPSKPRS